MPDGINPPGIRFWRRPTLARPIAVLPSGLQRFTAVFGMGTGGATALLSPEARAGPAIAVLRTEKGRRGSLETAASAAADALQFLSAVRPRLQHFRKNMIFNPQSQIDNPQFFWFSGS